jgi:two-component system response regulator AtoC
MTSTGQKILIIDDEDKMRRVLNIMLQRMGYRISAAENGEQALQMLQEESFDLVISDLRMPGLDGAALLQQLRASDNQVPFIVVTAYGTVESAVRVMKLGACDYIMRPFDIETIKLAIDRVLASGQMQQQNEFLRAELEKGWSGLIGGSTVMRAVYEEIRLVAPNKTAVLITGETGTGKELVAHAIHRASPRSARLFVAVNCAAIPSEMIESELFGYEKGAFTGALRDRIGKFELAHEGTLFLDELPEMPVTLQAKLLRVLQENVIERLGTNRSIPLDIRIIAATNRDPRRAIEEGRLRSDLYYRINVFSIDLPPLRQRREDIPLLARHFAEDLARTGQTTGMISQEAIALLESYDWPGNVRELRNVIERAAVLSRGGALDVHHFPIEAQMAETPAAVAPSGDDLDLNHAVDAVEARMIAEALRRVGGNKTKAASLLKISGRSLWYKLKKYRIDE